jgi:DNA-binding Xre family transcriptional regulator
VGPFTHYFSFLLKHLSWVSGKMDIKKKKEALVQFGKRLSQIRRAKKLSYRKLATLCDVDHSDIKKFEKGEVNITIATLMDLSIGLRVHPKELLNFHAEFLKDD